MIWILVGFLGWM